jgi:TRAP-type mannitol/chloroaromatic compound transport system permease small subunit
MIIVGFVFLLIQGVSQTIKAFYVAMGWETRPAAAPEVH